MHFLIRSSTAQSANDSSKRVEWWLEEKAALGALNALLRCWQWAPCEAAQQEDTAGSEAAAAAGGGDASELDLDNALPSLDEVLGEANGGGAAVAAAAEEEDDSTSAAAAAAAAQEWAVLEAQWGQVLRVLLHSVGGAVVAQLVQALLSVVGKDRDRDVRLLALQGLENLVGLLPSPDVWRPFFPGVFSGLLKVVLAGSGDRDVRQGSRPGALALRVALRVTAMLASPEANAALLPLVQRMGGLSLSLSPSSSSPSSSAPATATGAWQGFQAALLSSSTHPPQPDTTSTAGEGEEERPARYRPMAVPAKMAVAVDAAWARGLQAKLSDYLPLLLRACLLSSSPRIRQELAAGLAAIVGGEAAEGGAVGEGVSLLDFEGGPPQEEEEEGEAGEDGGEEPKPKPVGGGAVRLRVQVLDALVGLQGDEDPQAAATAQAALRLLLGRDRRRSLASASAVVEPLASRSRLLDRVAELLAELPGVAAAVQDRALRANLRLLRGYLELLLASTEAEAGVEVEVEVEAGGLPLLTTEMEATMGALAAALEPEAAAGAAPLQVIDPLPTEAEAPAAAAGGGAAAGAGAAVLGYYRQGFRNFRSEEPLGEMRAVLRLLGRAGGAQGAYLVVDHVLARLREGANRMRRRRRRHGEDGEGDGGLIGWAKERLPLVFILIHVFQGAAQQCGSGSCGGDGASLEAAAGLFLEGLFLTEGGVWRLPTGQQQAGAGQAEGPPSLLSPSPSLLLPSDATAAEAPAIPVEALDANARLVALLIQGVGDCCTALAAAARERCLMLALFPLVEKLGDPHPVVRQAALTSLHRLGAAPQQQPRPGLSQGSALLALVPSASGLAVGDLLAANLDYLVEALCRQVRRRKQQQRRHQLAAAPFPLAPAVLEALVAHAGPTASRALVRELAGVVFGAVDEQASAAGGAGAGAGDWRYSYGMMRVLLVLARAVRIEGEEEGGGAEMARRKRRRRRGDGSSALRVPAAAYWRETLVAEFGKGSAAAAQEGGGGQGTEESAEGFFRGYHRRKAEEGNAKDGELLEIEKLFPGAAGAAAAAQEEKEHEEGEEEEDEDDKPTTDEALLLEMVDRCAHFLAQPSLFVQHQALAVLQEALGKLHAHSRRNVLLPTVHTLWPALMARLHACTRAVATTRRRPGQQEEDMDPSWAFLLLGEALGMVGALVGLCGDFLSLKFTEELWPLLRTLLGTMARQGQGQGQEGASAPRGRKGRGGSNSGGGLLTIAGSSSSSSLSSKKKAPPLLLVPSARAAQAEATPEREEGEGEGPLAQPSPQQRQSLRSLAEAGVAACLRCFAESDACYRYTVPLVHDVAEAGAFLLGRPDPKTAEEAVGLFRALGRLDGAAVWPVLMRLAGWDLSTRPPTRVQGGGNTAGTAGGVRARRLLAWLEAGEEEMAWCAL